MPRKLTKTTALRYAVQLWGKSGAVRDSGVISSPDIRDAARIRLAELLENEPSRLNLDDMPADMLVGDYRKMLAARNSRWKQWNEEREASRWYAYHRRFAVGTAHIGLFIRGEGDTWEEAFAAAAK